MRKIMVSKWMGFALLGLFILSGCVQTAPLPQTGGQNTPTPTPLPPSPEATSLPIIASPTPVGPASETPSPETLTVALADGGNTITLEVGQAFLLNLGEGYDWTVTIADQSIVSREIGVLTIRGSQGLFMAHKPGQTTLEATGSPSCSKFKPPCMMPSRLFTLTIVVK